MVCVEQNKHILFSRPFGLIFELWHLFFKDFSWIYLTDGRNSSYQSQNPLLKGNKRGGKKAPLTTSVLNNNY